MQLELQSRRDTEVAPGAAEAPQQLGILIEAGAAHRAIGSNDLGTDEVVAGEAVLSGEMADSSAEGQPGDPGRADDPPGCNEPEPLGRRVEIEPPAAATAIPVTLPDAVAGNASPACLVTGLGVVPPMALDPALEARLLAVTGHGAAPQPGEQETWYHPDTSTSPRLTSRRRQTASPMTLLGANEGQAGGSGADPPGWLPCQAGASLPTGPAP